MKNIKGNIWLSPNEMPFARKNEKILNCRIC